MNRLQDFWFATEVQAGTATLTLRFLEPDTLIAGQVDSFFDAAIRPVFTDWGWQRLNPALQFAGNQTTVQAMSLPDSLRLGLPAPATGDLLVSHQDPRVDPAVQEAEGLLVLVTGPPADPRQLDEGHLRAAAQQGRLLAGWCPSA